MEESDYSKENYSMSEGSEDSQKRRTKSEELIIEAKNFFNANKEDLGESIRKKTNVVFLDFMKLTEFSTKLSDEIIINPEETLSIIELAVEELGLVKNSRVRLRNLSESHQIKIRNIRSKHLNELIILEGIIRQASDVRPQVVNAKFECPSCGTIISVLQIEKKFREPTRCSCGRRGGFKILSKEMVDTQRLVIEESPESLSGGEQPKRMNVFVKEDLVEPKMEDKTTPGAKVKVIGILKEVPVPLSTGGQSTRFELAVEANNIIPMEETFEELDISDEDERQIHELSEDPKIFENLSKSIAPSVWGYEEIKKALILQLFGGVQKKMSDGSKSRGDIHILLIGDPGVAKSIGKDEKIMFFSGTETGYDTIEAIYRRFNKNPKDLNVLTIDQNNHESRWEKVNEIIKHLPEKDLIKVETEHGKSIIATKDHSFITLSKNGEIIPITGEQLTKENYIPIPIKYHKELSEFLDTKDFNTKHTSSKLLPAKIPLDRDFGFFVGIFLSEGYIKNRKTIEISNKNEKIQKNVIKFAEKIGINYNSNKKSVSLFSKNLSELLRTYCYSELDLKNIQKGTKGNYSRIKRIPEFAYFSKKEFIYGVLSGLFSGDGRLIKDANSLKGFELITISRKLAEGASDLLFSMGIINKIKKRKYSYKQKETEYYSVAVPTYMINDFIKEIEIIGRNIKLNRNNPIYSYNNLIPCGNLVYEVVKKLGYNSRKTGDRTLAAEMRTVKKRNSIGKLRLLKLIKNFEEKAKEKIEELERLKKLANSNILWSKIDNIKILKEKNEEVYDLSIPSTNTFVSNGIGIHNSVTLVFMSNISPKGRYVVGKSASGAGLTATVVRDEYLKGWSLEAGAMVLANKGLVCIDELEKMDPQDRSAMHEAMEQQCMMPNFKLLLSDGKQVEIGKFIDNLIEKNKDKVYNGKNCEILPVKNVELISTDFINAFPFKADRVSRHIAPESFIKIELANGREIIVTPEHPCWTVKDGKITTISAENTKKGMFFPIPSEVSIKSKDYKKENNNLCKIIGYHIANGHYELNKGKKNEIQFWSNDKELISDYKNAVESHFKIKTATTKRKNQFAIRIVSKKVIEEILKIEPLLIEKDGRKIIPYKIMQLPNENIKYLLRGLYDGNGKVKFQNKNGCRISFVSKNKELEEQIGDLLLRFGIQSSISKDKDVWRIDISGQENLSKFLININFLSKEKSRRLKEYLSKEKNYKAIRDIVPNCTEKISKIFKKLNISAKKEIGHLIDLHVEKDRLFLQKLVLIAKKEALKDSEKNKEVLEELKEIERLAFGYAKWVKIKKVSRIKNDKVKWVYDVTIEPNRTFISNGMILHNTVTISKANVQASLKAQTSVLAAANPKFGRFDPFMPIPQQIDLPPTLINRFDIIFTLRDLPDRSKDERIAMHVLKEHQKETKDVLIDSMLLRKYVAYAKQKINPVLSTEAVDELKKFYVELRNKPVMSESAMRPIPISARQLQALIRMSEASARLKLNEEVSREDAKEAIELMKYYLMQVGYDTESKTFDIDRISGKFSSSQRNRIFMVKEAITALESKMGKMMPYEEIEKELEGRMEKDELEDIINRLIKDNEIYRPKKGYIGVF